jgi:hypothetical protein
MKKISLILMFLFIVGLISTRVLFGQNTGDFRSAQNGNWGDLTTWQTYNGSSWVAASTIPDTTSSAAVTILSPHNVTVAATIGVRNVTVNSGATVTVNGDPVVLYIASEGMVVNGSLTLTGNVPTASPYSVTKTTGPLTIGNGGVVNYDQGGTTKGALPIATWLTGSTLNVDSTGLKSATGWNAGGPQNFYNINWNCPLQTGSFGWGFINSTVGGTISILNTNTGRLQFFGGSSGTLNIMGDLAVSGAANVTNNGTSSGTNDTLNVYGKVNVNTTGNFSISRGSQAGVGTAIWNFYGDSVKIIAGTMQNSNTTPDGAKFIFKKNGTQYFALTPTALTGNATPIEIGSGATVSLLSPVNVTTLYLNGGLIVSSASNPLVMGWWTGTTLTSGTVSSTAPGSATSFVNGPMAYLYATAAGSTTKTYPIGKGGIYRPLTFSFTQTAATLSTYTAEIFNTVPPSNTFPGTLNKVAAMQYYTISEGVGGSGFTAGSVLLNYGNGDGVSDATNLRIAQGPSAGGGAWVDLGGIGSGSPDGTITSTTAFIDLTNTIFTLANNIGGSNSLPVELTSFTANGNGRNVQINWVTKTEVNSNKFEIERSVKSTKGESVTWISVGTVLASGTSTSAMKYSYMDKNLQVGIYQYRLKIINYDGSYEYSNVIETQIALPKNFELSQNYPNPFNPSTRINYSLPIDSKVILEVFNITGEKVGQLVNEEKTAGNYTVEFDSGKLSSGFYIYQLRTGNFVQTRKMILMK